MKNLKRALSLVLATVMVIGMMVVGASAAGYNDFADRDEIVNKDAVSMLTTLKVIEGDGTGNFRPEGTFTREAMAKMISVIMNKGVNNNDLFLGANSGLLDLDQAGDWAKGHINYCYTVGMIAGDGAGHFFPQAKLTAVAAAKMLLVAIGYDPVIEGLVGDQWDIKTAALASKLNIFDGYTKSVNAVLSRDDAALLIYNAMDVEMVETYDGKYAQSFKDGRTILSAMYGVYKVEGVVVANEWAELNETDSDAAMKTGKTVLDNVKLYGSTTLNTNNGEYVDVKGQVAFNVTTEAADLGKTVTLYVRKTTILANSDVLGYAQKDDVNDVKTSVVNVETAKDFLKGTGLATTKNTETYVNFGYTEAAKKTINDLCDNKFDFNANGVKVEVIDNNNDGDVDYILYTVETLSTVTLNNTKTEVLGYTATNRGEIHKFAFTDVETDADLAVGDLILYVEFGGRTYITVPETVVGAISRVDRDSAKELYVTIDGATYKQSYIENLLGGDFQSFAVVSAKGLIGTKYEFVLDSNGNIRAYHPVDESAPNYALVYGSAWTLNAKTYEGQIEMLMADGTKGLYDIDWDDSADAFTNGVTGLKSYLGTEDVENTYGQKLDNAAGTIIKYTINDDEVVTILAVMETNTFSASNNAVIEKNNASGTQAGAVGRMLDFTLEDEYEAGDGYVHVQRNKDGHDTQYAVDLNTLAFYYVNSTTFGVATGWDNIGTFAEDTWTQVWTTEKRDGTATSLAEVVLFNGAPKGVVAADWLLVLTSNYVTKDYIYLNVVFEDGHAEEIKVPNKAPYTTEFDDTDNHAYMKAYKYTVDSKDVYTLTIPGQAEGTATLLKNGTLSVDPATGADYYSTLTGKSNVWNVTDMTDAYDDATAGEFDINVARYAIVIAEDGKGGTKTVRTAWIWDVVGTDAPDEKDPGTADLLASIKVNDGIEVVANGYNTVKNAVANAEIIKMNSDSTQTYKIELAAKKNASGVEFYGVAAKYGNEAAALNANLVVNSRTGALSGNTATWKNTGVVIADGNYIVIVIAETVDAPSYYAYRFEA